jgi:RNA polymerase sigma-70 factor (ECF subfamily)
MDEAAFQAFYERTAPALWSYLRRVSGDPSAADDLLQESYLHFLRATGAPTEEAHQKNYLFRIATNLLRDRFRAGRRLFVPLPELSTGKRAGHEVELRFDIGHVLAELKLRERSLLWLAYVEGYDHEEIAAMLRCKAASVRPMLFRARQRLAGLLHAKGWKRRHRWEEKP